MLDIDKNTLFVSDGGGTLDYVSADGEVLASVAVPAGRVAALPYLDLLPEGASLQVASGVAVMRRPHRIGIQPYGAESHDSGANPDYRPTSASRLERELRLTMRRIQASETRVDAKLRALSAIERVPDAPQEPASEVIEEEVLNEEQEVVPDAPAQKPVKKKADKADG